MWSKGFEGVVSAWLVRSNSVVVASFSRIIPKAPIGRIDFAVNGRGRDKQGL